jgi:hypothetical protein
MTLLSGNPHPEDSTFCLLWLVVQKPKPWGNRAAKNHGPYLKAEQLHRSVYFWQK